MNALVEGIVGSDAEAVLTAGQLQALVGVCASTSPTALSPAHTLLPKIAATLGGTTSLDCATLCLRLCLLIGRADSHRGAVIAFLEAHHARLDAIAQPCVSALSTTRASRFMSGVGGGGRGSTAPAAKMAGEAELDFLSHLVLLMLASAETSLRAADVVEFLGADVEGTVEVLVACYTRAWGALQDAPAATPAVAGPYQVLLVLRVVELLRELTFWTTYEGLYSRLGIGSNAKKALAPTTGSTSMSVLSGPFRHHVGQLVAHLVAFSFFNHVGACLPVAVAGCEPASLGGGEASGVHTLPLIRSHLLLLQSLLTLTDQYGLVLRKAIFYGGVLGGVLAPLLTAPCTAVVRHPSEASPPLLPLTVAVAATLTFHSPECRQFWRSHGSVLVRVTDSTAAAAAALIHDDDATADHRPAAELVAQVVRLVVNSCSSAAVVPLLEVWNSRLDASGKSYVAGSLSNPKSRNRPLDILSPSYEALRCVFRLDTTAPLPVAARRATGGGDTLLDPGSSNRDQRRGRRNASRRRRRGSRGRSRGRGRRRRGRRGGARQARLQQRYHLLVQQTTAGTVAAQEQARAQIDALDLVGSSSSSSSDASSDETDDATEASEMMTPAALPDDFSRWRRGPPPRSIPLRYLCSLSHALIRSNPVVSSTGHLFDEDVIVDFLQFHPVCPVSGVPMTRADLVVDTARKEELEKVRANFV